MRKGTVGQRMAALTNGMNALQYADTRPVAPRSSPISTTRWTSYSRKYRSTSAIRRPSRWEVRLVPVRIAGHRAGRLLPATRHGRFRCGGLFFINLGNRRS